MLFWKIADAFFGHAVETTEIAAVCDCKSNIINRPSVVVVQRGQWIQVKPKFSLSHAKVNGSKDQTFGALFELFTWDYCSQFNGGGVLLTIFRRRNLASKGTNSTLNMPKSFGKELECLQSI